MSLFHFGWGSRARVFGVDVFGDHDGKFWYEYGVWPIYRAGRSIRDGIWWLRYRLDRRHRYHLIDTNLKPGYYDIDHLMLHGMFSLLRRYVEEEHEGVEDVERWGREKIEMKDEETGWSNEESGRKELEAAALYRWWMEKRPADLKRQDELLDKLYGVEPMFFSEPVVMDNGEKLYEMKRRREETDEEKVMRKEIHDLEVRIHEEETEMLKRLVDIRTGLWT